MKAFSKRTIFALSAVAFSVGAWAQDADDFGGDFDDGGFESDSFGFDDEISEPSLTWGGEVDANFRAWIGREGENETHDTRGYDSFYDVSKSSTDANASLKLDLSYEGSFTDAKATLKIDPKTISDYPEDVLSEASVGGSFFDGMLLLRAGKMKEVWGKGDKIHVLDNFNANDYTDFIFPDYIDRRLGEVMFKATANLSWDYNLKLEGIYTPWMTADRFSSDGMLVPATQRKITSAVTNQVSASMANYLKEYVEALENARLEASTAQTLETLGTEEANNKLSTIVQQALSEKKIEYNNSEVSAYMTAKGETDQETALKAILKEKYEAYLTEQVTKANAAYTTAYTNALNNASALSSDADSLYPDTHSLRYGQAGIRLTGTIPSIGLDWGTSYYYGHYKQPSFDARKLPSYIEKRLSGEEISESDKFLQYDQLQVFGLEAAKVIWKLNTRWEFAYNLTNDFDGTNRAIHNNSIAWVGGFDIDLPIHNLNINVQETGTYILKNSEIEDNADKQSQYDVDFNTDGTYSRNKLIVLLKDTFLNEKLSVEAQVVWGIENHELCIVPKIEYNVMEGLTFAARGAWLYSRNENGEFYNFTENSVHHDKAFFELSAKYQF